MKKRISKLILVVLIVGLAISMFSGCGIHFGSSTDAGIYANGSSGITIPGRGNPEKGIFVFTSFDVTPGSGSPSGTGKLQKNGGAIGGLFRDIAWMIYGSIFSVSNPGSGDQFKPSGTTSTFKLDPITVTKNTLTKTKNAMNTNTALQTVTQGLQGFAASVLLTIWAMGFISQIVNEKFTFETLLKTLMQLLMGIVVVTQATTITGAFADAGTLICQNIGGNNTAAFADFQNSLNGILKTPINIVVIGPGGDLLGWCAVLVYFWFDIWPLWAILLMAVPLFAQIMCAYKIVSIMIMRMIELAVRVTLSPIPLAFSAQNGFSAECIRYFRGVLACAMQPALILMGCLCLDTIDLVVKDIFNAAGSGNSIVGALGMSISYFVLNSYIGQTKQLSQEIIAR